MKTTTPFKSLVFIAVAGVLAASQQTWTASQLRAENRRLQDAQNKSEQARLQAKETAAASTVQAAEEAQLLRDEIVSLRSDLQEARSEIEKSSRPAKSPVLSLNPKDARGRAGLPQFPPLELKRVFHLRPGALTNLPPKIKGELYVHSTHGPFDDSNLWSGISEKTVLEGPPWNPSAPLPLSFRDAEEIGRQELHRFVQDEPQWILTELSLHRLWNSSTCWYYSLHFTHPTPLSRDFTVYVALNGAKGLITTE